MHGTDPNQLFSQSVNSVLLKIVFEISEIKTNFLIQLNLVASASSKIQHLLHELDERIVKIENSNQLSAVSSDMETPNSKPNFKILNQEIDLLKNQIGVLTEENSLLKNRKISRFLPKKPERYESLSSDNNSLSAIILNSKPHCRKLRLLPQFVREFRIDSAPISFKPSTSLLNDPRVANILASEEFSRNTHWDQEFSHSNRISETSLNIFSNKLFAEKRIKTNSPGKSLEDEKLAKPPNHPLKSLTILNRKPVKFSQNEIEDSGKTTANFYEANKQIITVTNFTDFQLLLGKMKDKINFSNYSIFSSEVDKNLQKLEEVFKEFTNLSKKIEGFEAELKPPNESHRSKLNETPIRVNDDSVYAEKSEVRVGLGKNKRGIFEEIENLKIRMNLKRHQEHVMEVQQNPTQLVSFIFALKNEHEKNLKDFQNIYERKY